MEPIYVPAGSVTAEPTRHGAHVMKQVLVRSGQITKITQIAIAELPKGKAEVEPHRHPTMWENYFILEERAIYHVGDQQIMVGPGDFLAIPPDTLHYQEVIEAPHRIFFWGEAID